MWTNNRGKRRPSIHLPQTLHQTQHLLAKQGKVGLCSSNGKQVTSSLALGHDSHKIAQLVLIHHHHGKFNAVSHGPKLSSPKPHLHTTRLPHLLSKLTFDQNM